MLWILRSIYRLNSSTVIKRILLAAENEYCGDWTQQQIRFNPQANGQAKHHLQAVKRMIPNQWKKFFVLKKGSLSNHKTKFDNSLSLTFGMFMSQKIFLYL